MTVLRLLVTGEWRRQPGMAAAGLFLGLALSTRWTSLWATGFLGLVILVVRGRRFFRVRELALVDVARHKPIPLSAFAKPSEE